MQLVYLIEYQNNGKTNEVFKERDEDIARTAKIESFDRDKKKQIIQT